MPIARLLSNMTAMACWHFPSGLPGNGSKLHGLTFLTHGHTKATAKRVTGVRNGSLIIAVLHPSSCLSSTVWAHGITRAWQHVPAEDVGTGANCCGFISSLVTHSFIQWLGGIHRGFIQK